MGICKLVISNGHSIVMTDEEAFVLDTGAPLSFRFDGGNKIKVGDDEVKVNMMAALFGNVTKKEDVDALTGVSTDGMLGMDFISSCSSIVFDTKKGEIHFNHGVSEELNEVNHRIPIHNRQAYITVDATTEKGDATLILDTGAFVNYLNGSLVNKTKFEKELEDFNPLLGEIHTNVYEMGVSMGGDEFQMSVAEAP